MRVFAYMATPSGLTGAPRRLLNLASALREQGIKMCIATQRNSDLFRVAEEQGLDTLQVEPIGVLRQRHGALLGGNAVFRLKALLSLLVLNLGIARKIRRQGADVVWIRGSKGIAFAGLGAILSRCPLVWDVDYELPSRGVVRWLHRLGLWCKHRTRKTSFHRSEMSPDHHSVVSFPPVSSMAVSLAVWDAQLLARRPAFRFSLSR